MAGENEAMSGAMGAGEASRAVADLATEAIGPLEEELRQRVSLDFGDRDLLAIESALLKAFLSGMQAAMGEMSESTIDQANQGALGSELVGAAASDTLPLPRLDPWASRYRDA